MITVPAERPILFSPEMVRALLRKDNPKTQTRRIVNPQPEEVYHRARAAFDAAVRADRLLHACEVEGWHPKCPYGKPGDRLWVREKWASPEPDKSRPGRVAYDADGVCGCWVNSGEDREFIYHGRVLQASGYRKCFPASSDTYSLAIYTDLRSGEYPSFKYGWRPSIHMPRWAARISLEITGVRAERVQDITADDVLAEGVELAWCDRQTLGSDETRARQLLFGQLWDRINGERAPWESNPWVWVVEFRRAA